MHFNEYTPTPFSNRTEYYRTREAKRKSRNENIKVTLIVTALFIAYCIIGGLECQM